MGSAQSARRIQPGGGSGRAGGPADLSRPPFLPTPPPALPPPPPPLPGGGLRRVRGRAGGAGGGVGGGPPPGRRPAAAGRISTAAVRRDRLRDGWEGRRGRWLGGPLRPPSRGRAGGPTPRVLQPPGSSARRIPGPREQTVAALSPLPAPTPAGAPPRGGPPRGGAPVPGGPGRPSHGATAPPPPPPPATGRAGGRGGLSPVRPGRVAPSGPGGLQAPRRDQSTAKRAHGVSGDVGHPPDPS